MKTRHKRLNQYIERSSGVDSRLDPVECADERGGGEEVSSEFVIARGHALPILAATEEVFDFVPPSVKSLRAIGVLDGGAAAWDLWRK